jgi:two-component sensor histidine kinase
MTSKDHNIKLAVSDNGIGLPADFDMNTVNTLGLELVKTLIQQLQGTLKLNKNHGTQFIITFTQNSQNITEEEQWKQPKL